VEVEVGSTDAMINRIITIHLCDDKSTRETKHSAATPDFCWSCERNRAWTPCVSSVTRRR